eukprot:gene21813-11034_t
MNLYVGVFPIGVVFRVWDLIFAEGVKVVFRVMLGVLRIFEQDALRQGSLLDLSSNTFSVGRTLLNRLRERRREWCTARLQSPPIVARAAPSPM